MQKQRRTACTQLLDMERAQQLRLVVLERKMRRVYSRRLRMTFRRYESLDGRSFGASGERHARRQSYPPVHPKHELIFLYIALRLAHDGGEGGRLRRLDRGSMGCSCQLGDREEQRA